MTLANPRMTIFCPVDDFCKELANYKQYSPLINRPGGQRGPEAGLAISEIMTILTMFHRIRFRDFKAFYVGFLTNY